MNEYINNQPEQIPYMGGEPVRCPRCSNVVTSRICTFCGLDLSTVYKTTAPIMQQPVMQPVPQQQMFYPIMQNQPPYQNNTQPQYQNNAPQYQNNNYNSQNSNNGYIPNNTINNGYNPYNQNSPNNMQNQYNQNQVPRQPINPYAAPLQQQPYMYFPPAKSKPNRVAVIICAVAAVLILLAVVGSYAISSFSSLNNTYRDGFDNGYSIPNEKENTTVYKGVSQVEFNKLKIGMSYAQISGIIGGDGELYDEGTTIEKENYRVYAWQGENNANASVFITITDDKVSDITLDGIL